MTEHSPHSETTDLLSLELDLLEEEQRRATLRHLETCTTCRMRHHEVRSGLTTLAEETRGAFDERNHVPSDLLEEYASAPSGLGAEVVTVIEAHLSQCGTCREEAVRAREATQDVWPTQAASGQLDAPTMAAARTVTAPRPAAEAPRKRSWWGIVAAGAGAVALLLVLRPVLAPKPPAIEGGVPVRLFGSSGPGAPAATFAVPAGVPAILLLKVSVVPDPLARYRVELRGASGLKLVQEISGESFDRMATVAVVVDSKRLVPGEVVEVRVLPANGGAPLFVDSFRVEKTP